MSWYPLIHRLWRCLPVSIRANVHRVHVLRSLRTAVASALRPHYDELYDEQWYSERGPGLELSVSTIAATIVAEFGAVRIIDFGCGGGDLLEKLASSGCDVAGLEYAEAGLALCRKRGLNVTKFDLRDGSAWNGANADIAICMEVAEHIPAPFAERLIERLTSTAPVVVFSAAVPGQGGRDHVNEQPHEYWIGKFCEHGCLLDTITSERWRREWCRVGVTQWYSQNLLLFRRTPE